MIPQFLIAAPSSASGKTTIARGLMALYTHKGLHVQPYKCGPDYIDTKYHAMVCGRPSVNLDSFMASEAHIQEIYARYADHADLTITEGMMGLYDGYDRDLGSSAEIARILHLPVILVVNARSSAYSIAPLIQGFVNFRKDVEIAGVIFNQVGSQRHFNMLKQACDDIDVRCFGYLPKQSDWEVSSRYLGLDFNTDSKSQQLIEQLDKTVDWRGLLELKRPLTVSSPVISRRDVGHILVARNADSFSFIYQEHIDILRTLGTVDFFDPEENFSLPDDTSLLYLPGGYPEQHAEALTKAENTRKSIREYAQRGGKVLAECGGMMYLCKEILTDEGCAEMCGVLPYSITARKSDRKLSLGYRQMEWNHLNLRGHEFHYTQFCNEVPASMTQVYNAAGTPVTTPVFREGNVIASYTHLYWGETDPLKLFL